MPRTKQPRPPSTFINTWSHIIRNLPFQVVDPKGDSELPTPELKVSVRKRGAGSQSALTRAADVTGRYLYCQNHECGTYLGSLGGSACQICEWTDPEVESHDGADEHQADE